jgi:hypothetical protein
MKLTKRMLAGLLAAVALLVGSGAALAHGGLGFGGFGLGKAGGDQSALLSDVAKRLNVSPAQLRKAIKDAAKAQVDQAVTNGDLTRTQADALKERIDEGAATVGIGPARVGDLGILEASAAYLGVTVAQLRQELSDGKSLADVAEEKNKSVEGLESAIVAEATKRLAQAVSDGDLTDAQRDRALTRLKNSVDELVQATPRGFGRGFHGPGFGKGFGGRFGGGVPMPAPAVYRS